jgi:hydroxymethylpyrimidine/phosphomethylpyrimidine kinase
LKGGHLDGDISADVVAGPGGAVVLDSSRVDTNNDHGTGCSLSAAIAAHLALGGSPMNAVERGKSYVHRALRGAAKWQLGSGHGPIDHFGWGDGTGVPR